MSLMLHPFPHIPLSQPPIMYHQHILRIVLLGSPGKVERPGDNRLPINNHHLVMSNRMGSIYLDRYPVVSEEGS